MDENKKRALTAALVQIEKQFGKGAIMRLGDSRPCDESTSISTGSLGLDIALGSAGCRAAGSCEIYGPESSGKTTLALHIIAEAQKTGGTRGLHRRRARARPGLRRASSASTSTTCSSRQPDTGEQALEIADMLVRSGAVDVVVDRLGGGAGAAGRDRGRDGRQPRRPAGAADVPGAAQAHRLIIKRSNTLRDLHQPDPR